MNKTILVMRLADMHTLHPNQDNSYTCARCNAVVGIFPAGVRAIKANPDTKIVCNVCQEADYSVFISKPVPGMFEDLKNTVKKQ
jgi:hypothetical protein